MLRVGKEPGGPDEARPRAGDARDSPARARDPEAAVHWVGDEQPPPPRAGPRTARVLRGAWVVAFLGVGAALTTARYVDTETLVEQGLAALLGVLLALGLAVRAGGPAIVAGVLAAAVGAAAVATGWEPMLAGAALGVGVLAACLAVLGTVPAGSFVAAVREVLVAQVVAGVGAVGVGGFLVRVELDRFDYAVLGLSLVAAFALVYRLGGGLHGLGRRGLLLAVGAVAVLVVALAYTAALARWGSPELSDLVRSAGDWSRDRLGAAPHPIEVLVGIPALAWGVSMRDRRRQGWWVCAFGVTATASATTRLVADTAPALEVTLAAVYSIALGLVLGYVVIRVDRYLVGTRGRRSRRAESLEHRPEPPRFWPLH